MAKLNAKLKKVILNMKVNENSTYKEIKDLLLDEYDVTISIAAIRKYLLTEESTKGQIEITKIEPKDIQEVKDKRIANQIKDEEIMDMARLLVEKAFINIAKSNNPEEHLGNVQKVISDNKRLSTYQKNQLAKLELDKAKFELEKQKFEFEKSKIVFNQEEQQYNIKIVNDLGEIDV